MFRNPFSFYGRIRRSEFCFSFLIYWIVMMMIIAGLDTKGSAGMSVLALGYIPLFWFLWAQGSKRCHDLGKPGIWLIMPFYVFWMLFQDGQHYINEYGENPKGFNGDFNPDHFATAVNPEVNSSDEQLNKGSIDLNQGNHL